jgi:hypothetical protein
MVFAVRSNGMLPGFLQSGLCYAMNQKVAYIFGDVGEEDVFQEFSISEADFKVGLNLLRSFFAAESVRPAGGLNARALWSFIPPMRRRLWR